MRLGVRAHDFGKLPVEELAGRIAGKGFTCVQLAPPKAIAGFDADLGRISPGFAGHVKEAFQRQQLQIAVLGCYINLADPDAGQRQQQLDRFKEYLRLARDFGCSVVGTETGSINPDYSFHSGNRGEEAFQTVLSGVRELVAEAERFGVFVGIEGVERYVISDPPRIRRLIDGIGSNNLQIIFDPVNLLSVENYRRQDRDSACQGFHRGRQEPPVGARRPGGAQLRIADGSHQGPEARHQHPHGGHSTRDGGDWRALPARFLPGLSGAPAGA